MGWEEHKEGVKSRSCKEAGQKSGRSSSNPKGTLEKESGRRIPKQEGSEDTGKSGGEVGGWGARGGANLANGKQEEELVAGCGWAQECEVCMAVRPPRGDGYSLLAIVHSFMYSSQKSDISRVYHVKEHEENIITFYILYRCLALLRLL